MKRTICVILLSLIVILTFTTLACAQEVSLSAQAYVLYCVENDTVLLSKNADTKMKMASTTKIMTALLTLQEAQKNDKLVEFEQSMIAEGSSMYLSVGDTLHLSDLAVGMMMCSGNDASNAAAISIAGSVENFALLMNEKAKQIGMKNTNFVTASGLDDENHYSTAVDMARLMAYALKNEQFCDIVKNKSMTVDFLTPQKQVTYTNHNRLLSMYDYCIGGKTGYTQSAGRCLVSAARKNGLTLVCVTFDAPDDWNDHIKMYDYGYERFALADTVDCDENFTINVVGSNKNQIKLYAKESYGYVTDIDKKDSVKRSLCVPDFLYAPINKGDYIGMITYTLDGEIVAQNPLFAYEDADMIRKKGIANFFKRIFDN